MNKSAGFSVRSGEFHTGSDGLTWGFTGRREGDMRQKDRRTGFLSGLGFPPESSWHPRQVHGSLTAVAGSPLSDLRLEFADAVAASAKIPGKCPFVLSVLNADCVPVLMSDEKNRVIAAGHAGWRGTLSGLIFTMIDAAVSLGATIPELSVRIGPHIRACCYSVDEARISLFKKNPLLNRFVRPSGAAVMLDLSGAIAAQLISAGIGENNIHDVTVCTSCRAKEYYSYRRRVDYDYGENLAFIGML